MGHLCQFCQRSFSRRYNRDRHEKQGCHKRLEQQQVEMDSEYAMSEGSPATVVQWKPGEEYEDNLSQDEEEQDEEYDDEDTDDESENNEDEDHSDDDNEITTTDDENDDIDPWDKLREEAIIDLSSCWEDQVEQYVTQGLSKEDAEFQTSTLLLPAYRKRLRFLYLRYLKWYHVLKTDPVHKKVMTTLRSFMDDDEMDFVEAAEAAINKRKYLLNKLIEHDDFSKQTLTKNDNDEILYHGRKRKYHEIH